MKRIMMDSNTFLKVQLIHQATIVRNIFKDIFGILENKVPKDFGDDLEMSLKLIDGFKVDDEKESAFKFLGINKYINMLYRISEKLSEPEKTKAMDLINSIKKNMKYITEVISKLVAFNSVLTETQTMVDELRNINK